MNAKVLRKIVRIDEEKCNGCGDCVPSCAEGALQIVDGKAKLISEVYCDGLGACLGECPQGAITVEEREAADFDEEAVRRHLDGEAKSEKELPCGCSSATVAQFERREETGPAAAEAASQPSMLGHWPVQLTLVPPGAPFLKGADLVLAADCVPFAYAGFHRDFLKDSALLVACPKLDDFQAHLGKLTEILRQAQPRSLTVVHMEVPCCSGLVQMARQAMRASGQEIPLREVTIGVRGDILSPSPEM
jgi:NAD-dependent dihydropyrimidine dehydrogenase PreA subunit